MRGDAERLQTAGRHAGLLPHAATSVSAIAIAFNIYGTLFMAFLGAAVAVGARVGNNLGANRPGAARLSAFTAVSVTPAIWVPLALVLVLPITQDALVSMFARPEDTSLRETLGNLLYIVAGLELLDGLQTVMSGAPAPLLAACIVSCIFHSACPGTCVRVMVPVLAQVPLQSGDSAVYIMLLPVANLLVLAGVVTGAGKQLRGAMINFVAFYLVAVPVACSLAFLTRLGVYGLYVGISLGPALQSVLYMWLINNIAWRKEAYTAATTASASG